jgi:RNA polymerase sigma-70 factor, ECF subfamily
MSQPQPPSRLIPLDTKQTTHEDDVRLIQLASSGDSVALADLYDRHAPLLHSVLTQKLGDSAESEDIVHDVFLKLHTKGALYNPSLGKPVAWLLTVARNMAIDQLRRRSVHQNFLNKQARDSEESAPARSDAHEDELEVLRHCVRILPDQQRDTLQLAYFSGLTQQEIAEELSQPLGSVKAWIRRGLMKLRECVEGRL